LVCGARSISVEDRAHDRRNLLRHQLSRTTDLCVRIVLPVAELQLERTAADTTRGVDGGHRRLQTCSLLRRAVGLSGGRTGGADQDGLTDTATRTVHVRYAAARDAQRDGEEAGEPATASRSAFHVDPPR
jgi:hypothetical protein